ncbi:hypothetical protein BCR41DRAFT_35272 [Lobosporangium transversale]|uniref:Uncharacterized protein n=1 Tax=Lobosporangium transversale TaxID=64571 RepID=A0A1Y2GRF8_9FUNG|nr:hypothetical protein BCR41DRAFT_35272 [Lobosporangium transversale]ORZ20087.1 hypothetical protein BCR41DRAFT_35272 [Lobosporangium transversale]|eukprot:XP_021882627.1 hypothetical protein BCR41DRAFT_35272 [Lobosporangium transversale]
MDSTVALCESPLVMPETGIPSTSGIGLEFAATVPLVVDKASTQITRPRLTNHGRSKSVSNRVSFSPGFGSSSLSTLSSSTSIHQIKPQSPELTRTSIERPPFLAEQPLGSPLAKQIENGLRAQQQSFVSSIPPSEGNGNELMTECLTMQGCQRMLPSQKRQSVLKADPNSSDLRTSAQRSLGPHNAAYRCGSDVTDLRELAPIADMSTTGMIEPLPPCNAAENSIVPVQHQQLRQRQQEQPSSPNLDSIDTKLHYRSSQQQGFKSNESTWALQLHLQQQVAQSQPTLSGSPLAALKADETNQSMPNPPQYQLHSANATKKRLGLDHGRDDNTRSRPHSCRPSRSRNPLPDLDLHQDEMDRDILDQQRRGDNSGTAMQRSLSIDSEFESFSYKNVTLLNDVNMEAMMNQSKSLSGAAIAVATAAVQGIDLDTEVYDSHGTLNSGYGSLGSGSSTPGTLKSMIQSLSAGGSKYSSNCDTNAMPSGGAVGSVMAGGPSMSLSSSILTSESSKGERPREARRESSAGYLFGLGSLTRSRSKSRSRASSAAAPTMLTTMSHINEGTSSLSASPLMNAGGNQPQPPPMTINSSLPVSTATLTHPPSQVQAPIRASIPVQPLMPTTAPTGSGHTIFGFGNGSFTKLPGSKSESKVGSRNGSTASLAAQSIGPGVLSMMLMRASPGVTSSSSTCSNNNSNGNGPKTATPIKKSSSSSLGASASNDRSQRYQHSATEKEQQVPINSSRRGSAISATISMGNIEKSKDHPQPSPLTMKHVNSSNSSILITPLVLERHEDWGQGLKMGLLIEPTLQTRVPTPTSTQVDTVADHNALAEPDGSSEETSERCH